MATFSDDFTAASDEDLGDHTPDTGTGWSWVGTGGSSAVMIEADDNAVQPTAVTTAEAGFHEIEPALSSADQQAWGRRYAFEISGSEARGFPAVRMVDETQWYGISHYGTGGAGTRVIAYNSTASGLDTFQGATGEWLRIKAEGSTITVWKAASGSEPTDPGADTNWTQVGVDHTGQTNFQTETSCGLANNVGTGAAVSFLQNFRADIYPVAAGGGARPQGALGHPFIGAFGGPI
tara:strand:- start:8539 stop:9243 length:705 start_codon:yes stop_codon:yes gene_type:complete